MYYVTFRFREPETSVIRYSGIKYKTDAFSEAELELIKKKGTSNKNVKTWIRELREKGQSPILEIIYSGESSQEACFAKQQDIINSLCPGYNLLAPKIRRRRYTKKIRKNVETRTPLIDQNNVSYDGVLEAAEKLCLSPSNISKVLHGHLPHASGYIFRFI